MGEDDLKNLKELKSKNKPRILTMYFEDGGETSVVPYDDYENLQQENQQLKKRNIVVKPLLYNNVYTDRLMPTCACCSTKVSQKDNYCKNCGQKLRGGKYE